MLYDDTKNNASETNDGFAPETTLQFALFYRSLGMSVIPVRKLDKLPAIKWAEFQNRIATYEEVNGWFADDKYNLGIVTGKISGITVVDCDSAEANKAFLSKYSGKTPTVKTPKGWHYYFSYVSGVRNTVRAQGLELDCRGDGGFVVAPPSMKSSDLGYEWIIDLFGGCKPDKMPESIQKIITSSEHDASPAVEDDDKFYLDGRRDKDIYMTALSMMRGGLMSERKVREAMYRIGQTCSPVFSRKECDDKVDSAIKGLGIKTKSVADLVAEYVNATTGIFTTRDVANDLKIDDSDAIRMALKRLCDEEIIRKDGKKNATWSKIDKEVIYIDWRNADTKLHTIDLPLSICRDLANIYTKSVIVLAGASNAGKTAFLLETVRLNMNKHKVRYMNSEMGNSELRSRIELFNPITHVDKWNFEAIERHGNWADIIDPTGVNIIDYLEINEDFWLANKQISEIHEKLTTGVAVVSIQKKRGAEFSYGGELTMTKPRLYLAMDRQKMKCVKCKSFKGTSNPDGKILNFSLHGGWKLVKRSEWHYEEKGEYVKYGASSNKKSVENDDVFVEE